MLIGGDKLTSQEAFECGLVTGVVEVENFEDCMMTKAKYLASLPPEVNFMLLFVYIIILVLLTTR